MLSLPKDCDQDGHHTDAYLAKINKKINDHEILRRLSLSFSQIIAYNTDKTVDVKMEDRGTARIQDYMINAEKHTVDNLAKTGKLSPSAYLIKDGSLEYIPIIVGMGKYADIRTFKDSYRWVNRKFNFCSLVSSPT